MKPITKKKIGWGIMGPGRIAKEFAQCLQLLDDCYIAAVGSRSMENAKRFAAVYGGKPYGSYEEMLQDPDVDVVYIATPHMVHEESVILAAKYGKNILCEKPFAINRAQAERMFEAADEAGVFIMEGLWSRFFPVWQEVKQLLASGELGEVLSVDSATCFGWRMGPDGIPPEDRRVNINLAGGATLDAGIYALAATSVAVGGLTKMPKKIYSTMRFGGGVDDFTDMLLQLEGDISVHIACSHHRRNHEINIYCEKGSIHIPRHRNPTEYTVTRMGNSEGRLPRGESAREGDGTASWLEGSRVETRTLAFPRFGFQYEAAVVHDCLRRGLRHCPQALPEESLTLIGICDKVRADNNFRYPFEKD